MNDEQLFQVIKSILDATTLQKGALEKAAAVGAIRTLVGAPAHLPAPEVKTTATTPSETPEPSDPDPEPEPAVRARSSCCQAPIEKKVIKSEKEEREELICKECGNTTTPVIFNPIRDMI